MEYFDKEGNIRCELLDKEAKQKAEDFVNPKPKGEDKYVNEMAKRDHGKPPKKPKVLTSSQLRRFFGEFRQLEKKVNALGFEKVEPLIRMVKSKAYYATNPNNQKIPDSFRDFLVNNINEIKKKKDFEAFMLHFEAVVGFCYGLGIKDN